MPRNIEIKAKARNFDEQMAIAGKLATEPSRIIHHEDTFYSVPKGRLKLRKFSNNSGELIFYQRTNTAEAKESNYEIYETNEPDHLNSVLSLSMAIGGLVKKRRTLFLCDQTRIHFDEVEGLGKFIELEVVMRDGQNTKTGVAIAQRLMDNLMIEKGDLIECAYIDMTREKK